MMVRSTHTRQSSCIDMKNCVVSTTVNFFFDRVPIAIYELDLVGVSTVVARIAVTVDKVFPFIIS